MTLLERPRPRANRRVPRAAAGLFAALGLLLMTACGLDAQTLQPYTPAEGVNADVGTAPVHVRNLMILSRADGTGYLSATMSTADRDALTSVTGTAYPANSTKGTAIQVTLSNPVTFGSNIPVILTNRALIPVTSSDLAPGLDAQLTLVFSTAGSLTIKVPVVDADQPAYETITPTPTPST